MTKGIAAGPFGNPYRYDTGSETSFVNGSWERAISIDRGLFSFVSMSRPFLPDVIGAAIWFGWDWPSGSVYHPIYCSQNTLPSGYDVYGKQSEFESKSSWRSLVTTPYTMIKPGKSMRNPGVPLAMTMTVTPLILTLTPP